MTAGVYDNCYASWNGYPTDAGDKGLASVYVVADADRARLAGDTCIADIDIVIARGERETGNSAQRDVVAAAGVVMERLTTDGRVGEADGVAYERLSAVRRVVRATGVAIERGTAGGRVEGPGGVAKKRINTVGRVVAGHGVASERTRTGGRVGEAGSVVIERSKTSGRVAVGGVTVKRSVTVCSVVVAVRVVGERIGASGTVEKPAGVAKER